MTEFIPFRHTPGALKEAKDYVDTIANYYIVKKMAAAGGIPLPAFKKAIESAFLDGIACALGGVRRDREG